MTDVTPWSPRALATPEDVVSQLDIFVTAEPEDLVLPIVRLVQGVSRTADRKRAGWFYSNVHEDYKERLQVAIFGRRKTRSLFREGDFESPPVCVSDDAVAPRTPVEVAGIETGPTCRECPFAQWGSARSGTGRGQACRVAHNLLCYDLDEDGWGPFILRVTGTSIAPLRRYITAQRFRRQRAPSYALETIITAEDRTFEAGQAFVMKFTPGKTLPPEVADLVRQVALRYAGVEVPAEGEEEGEVVEDGSEPAGGEDDRLFEDE